MKYLQNISVCLIAVFAPIQAAIITAFVLIIIDLVTGIIAAKKRTEPITSSGFKRTVGKILLYEAAICTAFLVQQYLTGDIFPASKLVTALVGLVEFKSILENLDSINGTDTFKAILSRILQSQNDMENKK